MLEQRVAALRQDIAETQRERGHEDGPEDQAALHPSQSIAYTGPTKRSRSLALAATAVILVAGFVYLQVARADEPLGLDQGLFACFGRWLRAGYLPYRDIFDSKPPLHLYTWVLAWAGGSTASAWWFEAGWLFAALVLGGLVARRWWGAWAGLVAAALLFVGLWSPGFGGYWSRLQAEELLVLPELAAAWFAITALTKPRGALACGVMTGIVGLYKVPGLAIGGAWLVLWLASLPRREAGRRAGWFVAGVLAPWLVAAAWFAAHGALGVFLDSVFAYQRHWIAMIDPPWGDVVDQFVSIAARELAPIAIAAAAGIWVTWRRDRGRALCLAAWIGLSALAIVLQRQLAGYHFLLLVPGLAIAAGCGVTALAGLVREARVGAVVVLVAIAVLLAGTARDWARAYGGDRFDREQFSPGEEASVARYIAAHTQPDDGILVWALAPGIYALADRHPVTRFPFHRLLLTDAPFALRVPGRDERRAAFLAGLRADPPAYIVLGLHDANPFEPQDSVSSLFAFRELNAIVQRDYHEEMRSGRFVVLARTTAR